MYMQVDIGQTVTAAVLREVEDFTSLKLVVSGPEHLWVEPDLLANLAGRSNDPAWQDRLAGMVAYADSKGWVDAQGRIRVHVELAGPINA